MGSLKKNTETVRQIFDSKTYFLLLEWYADTLETIPYDIFAQAPVFAEADTIKLDFLENLALQLHPWLHGNPERWIEVTLQTEVGLLNSYWDALLEYLITAPPEPEIENQNTRFRLYMERHNAFVRDLARYRAIRNAEERAAMEQLMAEIRLNRRGSGGGGSGGNLPQTSMDELE